MSQFKFENPDQLSNHQLWLIGTSAMLAQLNGQRHDTLLPFGKEREPVMIADVKQCLKRDWDIADLAGLSDTLEYLHQEKTFQPHQQAWEFLSDIELKKSADILHVGSYNNVMQMVHSYQFDLPGSDFAWHYGRCSWIIRMAAFVDFISEEEAWRLLEENGTRIKAAFSSWEEFGLSYMVGAQYWRREQYSPHSIQRYIRDFNFLAVHSQSPWINVPWVEQ